MNIQIYVGKKNPDFLKAERFFKERRIPYQVIDMKKHKLGQRELQIFVQSVGARALVDRSNKKSLERAVAHMTEESLIVGELLADSSALVSPIVRNGNRCTIGADEAIWKTWIQTEGW